MRAVSLSNKTVQAKIVQSFVPLKVDILPGTKTFPFDWPAMQQWRTSYRLMGGEKCQGITACTVVTPDLKVQYDNTGSAFVWEMFDSIAYDAEKFAAMLDRASERWEQEKKIRSDNTLNEQQRSQKLSSFRREVARELGREGRFHLPPPGFTIEGAKELFRLSGDLKDGK